MSVLDIFWCSSLTFIQIKLSVFLSIHFFSSSVFCNSCQPSRMCNTGKFYSLTLTVSQTWTLWKHVPAPNHKHCHKNHGSLSLYIYTIKYVATEIMALSLYIYIHLKVPIETMDLSLYVYDLYILTTSSVECAFLHCSLFELRGHSVCHDHVDW